jgi:GntR family transcriptional regulator/MocR family aminotransferase
MGAETNRPAVIRSTEPSAEGAGFPADLLIPLDRGRPRSLRAQLERGLREAIAAGTLAPGTALPASRVLARELAVSRSVVVDAYEQLVAEGYLQARRGSGTRVRADARRARGSSAERRSVPYWPVPTTSGASTPASGLPDPALFPRQEWLRDLRGVLQEMPDSALLYPAPRGAEELRDALAAYLGRVRGVRAGPDQVVVCAGFSQALGVLCRALARRGARRVAVEDPCFAHHRRIVRSAGLQAVPVPVDRDGLQVSRLEDLDVDAVVLSPAHSYPVGAVLSADRRAELVEWARRADSLVVEDDYDAELRYDRTPIGALQSLDPERVVYGGTISKVLSPALRLGWLIAPAHLVDEIVRAKFLDDIASETIGQLTLARFVASGGLARHLRRVRPVYRARRDRLLAALATHLPAIRPRGEAAGLHLLLELPEGPDVEALVAAGAAHGVRFEDARPHWAGHDPSPPAVLIGYGALRASTVTADVAAVATHLHARALCPFRSGGA